MNLGQVCALDKEPACFALVKNHLLCSYKLTLLRQFRGSSSPSPQAFLSLPRCLHFRSLVPPHTYSPPVDHPLHQTHPRIHQHAAAQEESPLLYSPRWAHHRVLLEHHSLPLLYWLNWRRELYRAELWCHSKRCCWWAVLRRTLRAQVSPYRSHHLHQSCYQYLQHAGDLCADWTQSHQRQPFRLSAMILN